MQITEKQVELCETVLATKLLTRMYHSVELVRDSQRNTSTPYWKDGKAGEYQFVGPDDSLGLYGYVRVSGDISAVPLKVGSCARSYETSIPMRLVFFRANEERDHASLLQQLLSVTFLTGVSLSRIITDKFKLRQDEAPQTKQNFDASTFYVAFEVLVNALLLPSHCEQDACRTFTNPICQP